MGLDMFLQILGALERLPAEVTLVWFQGHMYSDVGGDVIALHRRRAAASPLARQVEVVGAFAANVTLADMFLWKRRSAMER